MLFADTNRGLGESKQMKRRQLFAVLETDTPIYCKIERGERRAKLDQIIIIIK